MIRYRCSRKYKRCNDACEDLKKFNELSCDCEGVKLGRGGKLTLLQLATPDFKIYLFDILKLKAVPESLKEILESKSITKIMFDCRGDADSLYGEFGVRITNIYDLQLFEFMCRNAAGKPMRSNPSNPRMLRGSVIRGLGVTVQTDVNVTNENSNRITAFYSLKKVAHTLFDTVPTIWRYRPLGDKLSKYAALDVVNMWDIFKALKTHVPLIGIKKEALELASDRYASSRRDCEAIEKKFHSARLMSFIIPDIIRGDILKPFPVCNRKCNGCKRMMPYINMSSYCVDCEEILRNKSYFSDQGSYAKQRKTSY